jgi:3-oxoadipate enol-lactonase
MPSVRVGEVDVAYGVDGTGDPLVLLHGTSSSRVSWMQVAPLLSDRFTVLTPEFPGSGETVDPGGPLEVLDLATQAIAVADAVGAERFHLGGWSLGAVVAAAAASLAPGRVRSLTLVAGWARTDARMRFTFDLWSRLIQTDPGAVRPVRLCGRHDGRGDRGGRARGHRGLVPITAATLAPGTLRQVELDTRVDITARLAEIKAPTLVVGGVEDRWVDIVHSRHLATAIAGAKLVELPCGHLIPMEQADALAGLIAEHAGGR